MTLLEHTKAYAIAKHKEVNQKYDAHPYSYHLNMVYQAALQFIEGIPAEDRETVLAACWVHDIIEDARETYNDVKAQTNTTIADLAYALTNEKGRTRAERANDKYYKGIRNTKYASFIKFCDRIANVTYSKTNGSTKMFENYKKENPNFVTNIYVEECEAICKYLNDLFDE